MVRTSSMFPDRFAYWWYRSCAGSKSGHRPDKQVQQSSASGNTHLERNEIENAKLYQLREDIRTSETHEDVIVLKGNLPGDLHQAKGDHEIAKSSRLHFIYL